MANSRAISEAVLQAIGIDVKSYEEFVAWALCEHLAASLASLPEMTEEFFGRSDALKVFRDSVSAKTGRKWGQKDYELLFERVKLQKQTHDRKPVTYEQYVRLLWQVPLKCVFCGRAPPDVVLHVDHIFPASRGGSSLRKNLQFLCAEHNLRKSNNLEGGKPWLNLR
jgi:5-methylcytosine-specific restriction endonuclease McrA